MWSRNKLEAEIHHISILSRSHTLRTSKFGQIWNQYESGTTEGYCGGWARSSQDEKAQRKRDQIYVPRREMEGWAGRGAVARGREHWPARECNKEKEWQCSKTSHQRELQSAANEASLQTPREDGSASIVTQESEEVQWPHPCRYVFKRWANTTAFTQKPLVMYREKKLANFMRIYRQTSKIN